MNGRILQADPFIQAPGNSQSYNRYSYVLNNPLSYTDPSGYFFDKLFKGINKVFGKFAPLVAIAIAWWNPGALLFNSTWAAGAGSVLNGGKFGHGFLSAGLAQGLSGKINSISTKLGRVTASAVVGGTVSKLTGGKFANGAMTGAFSRALNDEGAWTKKDVAAAQASKDVYDSDGGFDTIGVDYDPVEGFGAKLVGNGEGKYTVAFRGTDEFFGADAGANAGNATGLGSEQYDMAISLAMDVVDAVGAGNVTFTGHSLGGGLASAAAYATGGNAITFNAAGLHSRYITNQSPSIRAHIIRTDYLSLYQNTWHPVGFGLPNTAGTRVYHWQSVLDPHSIDNFINR
jgi:hypothetical protein